MREVCLAGALVAALIVIACSAIAAEPVDVLLVLASDVSESINDPKFKLERDGYIAAITDPRVMEVIRSGPYGRIAICFVEWSGSEEQKIVIDWTMIGSSQDAQKFGKNLDKAPRPFSNFTSISAAIDFATKQLDQSPFYSERRIIDISGDGTSNQGREVTAAREEAIAQGDTINGLVILSEQPLEWDPAHTDPPGGLKNYYRDNVIGGPNSFVKVAETFNVFGQAMLNKLVSEIASARYPTATRFAESVGAPMHHAIARRAGDVR